MSVRKWLAMPLGVSLLYAVFASIWIAVSDYVLIFVMGDADKLASFSMAKGFIFVAITSVLLFILLTSWQGAQSTERRAPPKHVSRGLIASFFVTALLVPLITGALVWKQVPQAERHTQEKLSAYAQMQADQIKQWQAERFGDALILQKDVFLIQAIQRWLTSETDTGLQTYIDELFSQRLDAYGYVSIEIYFGSERMRAWGERHAGVDSGELIERAARSLKVEQSHIQATSNGDFIFSWATPLPAEDMQKPFVVVMHASLDQFILKNHYSWATLPQDAHSYLLAESGDRTQPLLYRINEQGSLEAMTCQRPGWILSLHKLSISDELVHLNCDEQEAISVMANVKTDPRMAVITQTELDQVYAPLKELVWWVTLASVFVVVLLSIILWLLWRRELLAHHQEIEAKAAEKDALLDYISHYDRITSLPNRVAFMSRLSHHIKLAKREKKRLALVMFDLDRFKDINDSYGHAVGDELLSKLASRLLDKLGQMDTLARIGGDEFALLIEDLDELETAANLARQLAKDINKPIKLTQGAEVRISVTMGISVYPNHGISSDELLQHADAALYRAKADGKGGFAFYNDELTKLARQRVRQELQLKQAIFKQHLKVFYQPQLDVKTGHIVGAEALLRWMDPEQGLIAPVDFIPLAEETGLILEIGEWVIQEVCRQGRTWLDAGHPKLRLAVNLSAQQFRHGGLDQTVKKALINSGFPANQLELELTESALMQEASHIDETLSKLRKLGVTVAIDDFGTGYSSLSYLKRFALDVIKIDKSFISDINHEKNGQQIVNAIVTMGHALGMVVLAEGVEDTDQLAYLIKHECDLYQGFLVSQALPADEFIDLYRQSFETPST